MSSDDGAARLLDELGRRLGIEGLAFDERGQCTLLFDRQLKVTLAIDPQLRDILLFAVLGDVVSVDRPCLLQAMLRGNYLWRVTGGATLSLSPDEDKAVLLLRVTGAELTPEALEKCLGRFVDSAMAWIRRIEQPDEQALPVSSSSASMTLLRV